MGLFGLFSKANKEEKGKESWRDARQCEVFRNIDYLDENNEPYLNVIEDIILGNHAKLPNGDKLWNGSMYYAVYNFLCNVLNEEAAIFLTGGEELKTVDGYCTGEYEERKSYFFHFITYYCDLLKCWKIKDILDKENWLVRYFKSPEFKKVAQYYYENIIEPLGFAGFYNFYASDKFAEEDLSDESIVYYPEFVVMCSKGDEGHVGEDALMLLEMYHALKDDPELRKKILFKDDSHLRGYNYIMMDYKKYRENGSL